MHNYGRMSVENAHNHGKVIMQGMHTYKWQEKKSVGNEQTRQE